jgi:NADPH:quinone reductase-like Zn-dependent oxidoreductase
MNSQQIMRQWEMSAIGRKSLSIGTTSIPQPQAGEVLVKVAAVALNSRDSHVIENGMGLPLEFPFVPATDMAGTVVAVGTGVTRFEEGDRAISTYVPDWTDGPPVDTGWRSCRKRWPILTAVPSIVITTD